MLLRGSEGHLQPLDVILKRIQFLGKRSRFLEDVSVMQGLEIYPLPSHPGA